MDKWISVKEELPGNKIDVLFHEKWCNTLGVGHYSEEDKEWFANEEFVEAHGNSYIESVIESKHVTHWMALPEMPTEGW